MRTKKGLKKEKAKRINREELINEFLSFLKERYDISDEEILQSVRKEPLTDEIPIDVFKNDELSALETISKYLRENCNLTFSKIGKLTNRDPRVIGRTYHNAVKKLPKKFIVTRPKFYIPVDLLKNRRLSVLENIVSHIKEHFGLNYHEIALLLNRDDSTIWTVYNRAKKKK